jgi:hypothetical protein
VIEMLRLGDVVCAGGVSESVTVTVKFEVPRTVGVPVIAPVGASVRPVGSVPEFSVHV